MSFDIVATYAVAVFLFIGAIFALIGVIGLLKFNDPMTRLHAPTKVGTVGIGALLLASILYFDTFHDGSIHELLIMAFLFVTAPISSNFIAKVIIHQGTCETPPEPVTECTWSTLGSPNRKSDVVEALDHTPE